MRSFLVLTFLILFFILTIPILLVEHIIGKFTKRKKVSSSGWIVKNVFKFILFLSGVKYTVKGIEHVPTDLDTGVLYVANHRSYFDIPVFFVTVPTISGFISKIEMSKIPILRIWMRNINCLFLDRDNIREGLKTILQGIELIKDGYSVFIAPEGTRNQNKEMLPFKEGSFKIAEKSGCPIIPVSITNTDNILENHFPWIRRGQVTIEYGKPIYMDKLEKDDRKFIGAYVKNIIEETLEKNDYE